MKPDWNKLSEKKPQHNAIVFISDGYEIALAQYSAKHDWWNGCGFSGYEWDWDFAPEFWAECNIEKPQVQGKS